MAVMLDHADGNGPAEQEQYSVRMQVNTLLFSRQILQISKNLPYKPREAHLSNYFEKCQECSDCVRSRKQLAAGLRTSLTTLNIAQLSPKIEKKNPRLSHDVA